MHPRQHLKHRLAQLTILVSFLITFASTRAVTHLQKAEFLPIQQGELHIHHLVPGIFLVLISGYLGISFWNHEQLRYYMAILFGIGAALTIDEFALWLHLDDVYWALEGRISIDAMIIVTTILSICYVGAVISIHLKKSRGR
jgi:hypothetical protein